MDGRAAGHRLPAQVDQRPDAFLVAAQQLFIRTLPPMLRAEVNASDVATSMVVDLKPAADPAVVASRFKAQAPSVATMMGADFDMQIGGATAHP